MGSWQHHLRRGQLHMKRRLERARAGGESARAVTNTHVRHTLRGDAGGVGSRPLSERLISNRTCPAANRLDYQPHIRRIADLAPRSLVERIGVEQVARN